MERVDVTTLPDLDDRCAAIRGLGDVLGTEDVSINYFELDPGESPALGLHAHPDQEEVFCVLAGEVTFEFAGIDPGSVPATVRVDTGEAIRFAPGEYQRAWNRGEIRVELLAVGAPRSASADVRRDCPTCGVPTRTDVEVTPSELVTRCGVCGTETRRVERYG